jgi:hypothetical protein
MTARISAGQMGCPPVVFRSGGASPDGLPVDTGLHQETVRQHVMATDDRLEAEIGPEQFMYDGGCQREIEASPEPGPPLPKSLHPYVASIKSPTHALA